MYKIAYDYGYGSMQCSKIHSGFNLLVAYADVMQMQ